MGDQSPIADGRRFGGLTPIGGYFTDEQDSDRGVKWYNWYSKYRDSVRRDYTYDAIYYTHKRVPWGAIKGLGHTFGGAMVDVSPKTEAGVAIELALLFFPVGKLGRLLGRVESLQNFDRSLIALREKIPGFEKAPEILIK